MPRRKLLKMFSTGSPPLDERELAFDISFKEKESVSEFLVTGICYFHT